MKWFIELIGDALIIVFGLFSLNLLVPIWIWGEVLAYEGNELILAIEIILAGIIILFGIERTIKDLYDKWKL